MKPTNYQKELYRGTLKQIMKVRGLRTISLANFNAWKGSKNNTGIHSLKLDVQDGYMNIFDYAKNGRCGLPINDATEDMYRAVYDEVMELLSNEHNIPSKVKRNILVKVSR